MGIPYSHQINEAFDQVTPLVASGFQVLETTKNIAVMLAVIQVYTAGLLTLILLALLGLLFSLNPDLEVERRTLVTPAMRWLASWIVEGEGKRKSIVGVLSLLLAIVTFAAWLRLYYVRQAEAAVLAEEREREAGEEEEKGGKGSGDSGKKKDVQAGKNGKTEQ